MILYKYRNFESLEFALDIFVRQRLFAADFKSLNDPMEGRFVYSKGILDRYDLQRIRGEKAEYNILSLSATPNNMLMWSYYASGHNGFVVGVDVTDTNTEIEEVDYVEDLVLDRNTDNLAKSILTKKLRLWNHEKEYRVLKRNDHFVGVEVKELIFGVHANPGLCELISEIALRFCPGVKVRKMQRQELETGVVDEHEL